MLSYIPYEGQVDVKVKKPVNLQLRIPGWAKTDQTVCTVNGQSRQLEWEDRFALVGDVKPDDLVELTFPIEEHTVSEQMWGVKYTMVIKGNTVVYMSPPGTYYPFYQRDHYRQNQVRWVKRKQFVAAKVPGSWPY